MDAKRNAPDASSELVQALELISKVSRGLPAAPQSEVNGYAAYGPPNRLDEGVRLRDVWQAVSKRLWMIILIVVLITSLTALMLARKPDIYMAETNVQVDTESPATGITSGKGGNIIVDNGADPSYF